VNSVTKLDCAPKRILHLRPSIPTRLKEPTRTRKVKVCHRSASDTRQGSLCRFVLGRKHEHNHAFSLPRVTSFMRRAWGQRFARGRCSQLGPKDRFDSGGQSVSMLDVVCSGAKVAPPHSLRLAAQAHMAGKAHGMGVDIAWHMLRNLHAPMPANLPFYPPFAMWPCKTSQSKTGHDIAAALKCRIIFVCTGCVSLSTLSQQARHLHTSSRAVGCSECYQSRSSCSTGARRPPDRTCHCAHIETDWAAGARGSPRANSLADQS
jgi:hypothetical protein